jgi:hypothetical protein
VLVLGDLGLEVVGKQNPPFSLKRFIDKGRSTIPVRY